jgi:hypothetical protein
MHKRSPYIFPLQFTEQVPFSIGIVTNRKKVIWKGPTLLLGRKVTLLVCNEAEISPDVSN